MTEQEISVKLTETEQRAKSNTHRIEKLEQQQKDLNKLVTAVEVLASREKGVETDVKEIKADVKTITQKGGKRWDAMIDRVLYVLIGAAADDRGELMKGKRRRTKKKRVSFSKLLLLLESGIVLYTTYEGFALAKFAVASGFMGTLPWIATMVTAAWGAYGTSAACYYAKAKAENTAGGVTYETVCRGQDCEG